MLAITNVRLIDGTGAAPVENCTILIENGKIAAVGCGIPVPEGANVIHTNGKTVIPGLIDAHTHIGGSSSFDHPSCGNRQETYDYIEAREGFLQWGVTSVRTCGDQREDILSFRDDANAGRVLSPRVISCGPFLQSAGGHPWGTVYMKAEKVAKTAAIFADDQIPIERQVASIAQLGVNFIKVFYAHLNKIDYPNTVPRMSREQLKRAVDSAHRNGLKCAVHVDSPSEMLDAAQVGVDVIEHMIGAGGTETVFSDEVIQAVKDSGAVVDPTMISILRFDETPGFPSVWEPLNKAVRQFYEAGIPLVAGCDSGIPFVPFGESLHDELDCLVKAGLPPMEVLSMATLKNARLLGLEDKVGSIQPGKDADLILLNDDPLANIQNTRKIGLVLMRGKIIRDEILGA